MRLLYVAALLSAFGIGEASAEDNGERLFQMFEKSCAGKPVSAGIPATGFITHDIDSEYRRLKALGVKFRGEPAKMGPIVTVLFEDGCGNLINLV
jgi:hypothetical protein